MPASVLDRHSRLISLLQLSEKEVAHSLERLAASFTRIDEDLSDLVLPKVRYVMATTSRVGGHYLGQLLKKAGAGTPLEYFAEWDIERICKGEKISLREYFVRLFERECSPLGAFGVKVSAWGILPFLVHDNWPGGVRAWNWVCLSRDNMIDQAVSLSIAEHTGKWNEYGEAKSGEPPWIGADMLFDRFQVVLRERMRWEAIFSIYSIRPVRAVYEDVAENGQQESARILESLGLPTNWSDPDDKTVLLRKQADFMNKVVGDVGRCRLFGVLPPRSAPLSE